MHSEQLVPWAFDGSQENAIVPLRDSSLSRPGEAIRLRSLHDVGAAHTVNSLPEHPLDPEVFGAYFDGAAGGPLAAFDGARRNARVELARWEAASQTVATAHPAPFPDKVFYS